MGRQDDKRIYPCIECGVMRSKNEGGTTFTVCDECWDKSHPTKTKLTDRLLSGQEQLDVAMSECESLIQGMIIAQDLKSVSARDKEWVEWIEKEFSLELRNLKECTDRHCKVTIGKPECYKTMCIFYRWQERKKEIGL